MRMGKSNEEERKIKEDLEEVSYGGDTERREDVEGDEEIGCGQRSLEELMEALCSHTRDYRK
jgi:hypothetical protein